MSCYLQSSTVMVAGKEVASPLLVDRRHRFIEPASSYIRYVATVRKLRPGSVQTYASWLLHFCNYLARKLGSTANTPATSLGTAKTVSEALLVITDAHLKDWMDEQGAAENQVHTVNQRLDAVFLFHIWMEINGHVTYAVRVPGVNDHERFTPRLSSRPARRNSHGRRPSRYGIVSDLRMPDRERELLPTPDDADMTKVYAACTRLFKRDSADRNQLMLAWGQQRGVRRHEWGALKIKQLPSREKVREHCANFSSLPLTLTVTKGGHQQSMKVLPGLCEQTYEYIDGERADIVRRFSKREGYVEPEEIFLSSEFGKPLALGSISNIMRQIFDEAGVEGHGHRIRAHFLENAGEAEADAEELAVLSSGGRKAGMDWDGVEVRLAEHARQKNPASLKPYIGSLRKQRNRSPQQQEFVTLQQAVEAKKQEAAILDLKLAAMRDEVSKLKAEGTSRAGPKEPSRKVFKRVARGQKTAQR